MPALYDVIKSLCDERGVTGGKMCVDLGLSKSTMTDLKSGRRSGISTETAQKIADYLNCSVDYLLGRTDSPKKEKAPTAKGDESFDKKSCTWSGTGRVKNNFKKGIR